MSTSHVQDTSESRLREAIVDTGVVATSNAPVIVEAYHENCASLGLHFEIAVTHATLLGAAEIVLNPTFSGTFWSRSTAEQLPSEVIEWAQAVAEYCRTIGHVGPLSVDIVRTHSGDYLATEVNGRHGGFSTIRSVAQAVGPLDAIEAGSTVALARNDVDVQAPLFEVLDAIQGYALSYDSHSRSGVVVMSEGGRRFRPLRFRSPRP